MLCLRCHNFGHCHVGYNNNLQQLHFDARAVHCNWTLEGTYHRLAGQVIGICYAMSGIMVGVYHLKRQAYFGFPCSLATLIKEIAPEGHMIVVAVVLPD